MCEPTMPLAPGRLSITTCWPRLSLSFGAIVRARMSVMPPAPLGMMRRIGRTGNFSAAAACSAGAIHSAAVIETAEARSVRMRMAIPITLHYRARCLRASHALAQRCAAIELDGDAVYYRSTDKRGFAVIAGRELKRAGPYAIHAASAWVLLTAAALAAAQQSAQQPA